MIAEDIEIRYVPESEDIGEIRAIVESTGYFFDYEADVAEELIRERIDKGEASGYEFIFAEIEGRTAGFTCYGHIACTKSSYDLYWIVVHNDYRGRGTGRYLLEQTEKMIKSAGGKKVYAETSSLAKYLPTRKFYETTGYKLESVLKDFYDEGDDKCTYVKIL